MTTSGDGKLKGSLDTQGGTHSKGGLKSKQNKRVNKSKFKE